MERFHRHLNGALRAGDNPLWSEIFSLALLSIWSPFREEMRTLPNELVWLYDFVSRRAGKAVEATQFNRGDYGKRLAQQMRTLHASSTRDPPTPGYIPGALNTSTHVFARVDGVRPTMQPSYAGPFCVQELVIKRSFWTLPVDVTRCPSVALNLPLDYRSSDGLHSTHDSPFRLRPVAVRGDVECEKRHGVTYRTRSDGHSQNPIRLPGKTTRSYS